VADLYLDNDVSLDLAPLLRNAGHRVTATRDLAHFRAPDDAQLLTAARNNWVLVTYNRRDFAMLHDAWLTWPAAFGMMLPAHPGILALDHAPIETQGNAVATFLATAPPSSLANGLFWWHHRDGWRRRVTGIRWEPYP
jgi:hypothetical protein